MTQPEGETGFWVFLYKVRIHTYIVYIYLYINVYIYISFIHSKIPLFLVKSRLVSMGRYLPHHFPPMELSTVGVVSLLIHLSFICLCCLAPAKSGSQALVPIASVSSLWRVGPVRFFVCAYDKRLDYASIVHLVCSRYTLFIYLCFS